MTARFTAQTPDGPIVGVAAGPGDGTPLLLLHGGPGISDNMDMLDEETAGWRTIRYQQRGLAPSLEAGPFTVEAHVGDAIAVLDELNAARAVVLGHSWGGHLALQLAVAHPDRVAALVIVDGYGVVGDGGVADVGQNLGARLSPASAGEYAAVAERLAGPEPTVEDATESLRLLWPGYFADQAHAMPFPPGLRMSLTAYVGTFTSVNEHLADGFAAALSGVKAPAEFVLGAASPMPVSQGEQTAAFLPSARVTVVPGAGHLPWYERPGCVAAALGRVRERVSPE